jgi:hypothetical protein
VSEEALVSGLREAHAKEKSVRSTQSWEKKRKFVHALCVLIVAIWHLELHSHFLHQRLYASG